jgi:hypothetical protein
MESVSCRVMQAIPLLRSWTCLRESGQNLPDYSRYRLHVTIRLKGIISMSCAIVTSSRSTRAPAHVHRALLAASALALYKKMIGEP